jgi:hypothetical protein
MASRARFELATNRLTADCSTTELPRNKSRKRAWRLVCSQMRKTFKLAAQEVGNVAARHGWRDEVFGKNAIAMRKGELAIALEKGEAVIVDLEAEQ